MEQKEPKEFSEIGRLLFHAPAAVRTINLITLYRTIAFPLLIALLLTRHIDIFKWFLLASFITDAIDGFLARRYNATSILGSKLDSIGDDLTILAATVGLFITRFEFVRGQAWIFGLLFLLFLAQVAVSIFRYRKISTFHTYLAKTAAVVAAAFLLSVFFLETIYYPLFYIAAVITGLELIEEIILAVIIPDYRSNVKGLYWVMKEKN